MLNVLDMFALLIFFSMGPKQMIWNSLAISMRSAVFDHAGPLFGLCVYKQGAQGQSYV